VELDPVARKIFYKECTSTGTFVKKETFHFVTERYGIEGTGTGTENF
jgi:hypothetical protein